MKKLLAFPLILFSAFFTGCTISVVDTHTESGSTETVDADQDAQADVKAALSVPVNSPSSGQTVTPSSTPAPVSK